MHENISLDHGFTKGCLTGDCLEEKNEEFDLEIEQYTPEVKELFGYGFEQINHYVQMLIDEGQIRGLIGPRELSRIWSRHIVNCAAIVDYIPEQGKLADIGSGAGLPGIVIAVMKPDLDVYLIEPMQRRVKWLQDVVEELGLDNVTIYNNRAEELHKKISFDCVTARAVGSIEKLSRWISPLIKTGGKMVLLKGEKAADELQDAKYTLKKVKLVEPKIHKVKSVMNDEKTTVVEVKKK